MCEMVTDQTLVNGLCMALITIGTVLCVVVLVSYIDHRRLARLRQFDIAP